MYIELVEIRSLNKRCLENSSTNNNNEDNEDGQSMNENENETNIHHKHRNKQFHLIDQICQFVDRKFYLNQPKNLIQQINNVNYHHYHQQNLPPPPSRSLPRSLSSMKLVDANDGDDLKLLHQFNCCLNIDPNQHFRFISAKNCKFFFWKISGLYGKFLQ